MKISRDLGKFLDDFPALSKWKKDPHVDSLPRLKHKNRLTETFSIEEYLAALEPAEIFQNYEGCFLFAHFSPFEYELEALGLPSYASKMFPKAKIHFTYDKGGRDVFRFEIKNGFIVRKDSLDERYDLVVCRSSVMRNMYQRKDDKRVLEKSGCKINIKTMSLKNNQQLVDYYFEEEEMCPPPDPFYLLRVEEFLNKHKKENLIVVSGSLWHIKNQLKMFKQLDPEIIKNFRVIIVGPHRDKSYVKDIINICNQKKIYYYLTGRICKELAHDIKTLSKISLIPMDMRVYGQPKGYPRTLGESIGSKCLTLCNAPVTVPEYYKNSCLIYDESCEGDFNHKLSECVDLVRTDSFINKHDWGSITMEDVCYKTMIKCLKLMEQ